MFLISKSFCNSCNGRGFHWVQGSLVSRRDGKEIASIYRKGDKCQECNGTGEVGLFFVTRRFCEIIAIVAVLYMAWQLWRVF